MRAMRTWPLTWTLPLLVLVLFMAVVAILAWLEYRYETTEMQMRQWHRVNNYMGAMQRQLENHLDRGDLVHAEQVITMTATQPEVLHLALLDEYGRVQFANRFAWKGEDATVIPEYLDRNRQAVKRSRQSLVEINEDGTAISAYFPIRLPATAGEIRGSRLGLLYLRYDLERALSSIQQKVLFESLLLWLAAIAALLLLLGALHRLVTRPIQRLINATRRIAKGDFQVGAKLTGRGELAALSENFDIMAWQLRDQLESLQRSEERVRLLLESTAEAIYGLDKEGYCTFCNPACARMLGYDSPEDLVGRQMHELIHHSHEDGTPYDRASCPISQAIRNNQGIHIDDEVFWRADGTPLPVEYWAYPVVKDDAMVGSVVTFMDISERRRAQAQIAHQAHYDELTQLPNRYKLLDHLQRELARARRHHHYGALLFLDLDHFKDINDTLGHPVGDQLLVEASRRLTEVLRNEDVVARWGGDEFVILMGELDQEQSLAANKALTVAQHLSEALGTSFQVNHHQLQVRASIGITLFPISDESAHDLLKRADIAMYQSKSRGRNTISFFSQEMQQAVERRLVMEHQLRGALENNELLLHYQPQFDSSGRIVAAEALLRWHQPYNGMIPPLEFIGVAEQTNLILPLGEWVLREACQQLREWRRHSGALMIQRLAINVSPRQFQQPDFVDQVRTILSVSGVEAHWLELEITESLLLDHTEETIAKMRELKDMGVHLAIDDFGTGYSSLRYLTKLPLDKLKIDQSFVRGMTTDDNHATVVETIISMAQLLKLEVVAEGVETAQELAFLEARGCHQFQGYYFSKPLAQHQFEQMLGPAPGPRPH